MIRVSSDLARLSSSLTELQQRQVPFATARALTVTAQLAAGAVTRQLPTIFDRPTPFTLRAIGVQPATKRHLEARVFVKDRQAEYLALEETGGTRQPKTRALIMPKAAARNAYGNLARNAVRSLKRRKDVFVGQGPGGQGGIYRRRKDDTLQPLIVFVASAHYKPRFGFKVRVGKVVRAAIAPAFREQMRRALATARR